MHTHSVCAYLAHTQTSPHPPTHAHGSPHSGHTASLHPCTGLPHAHPPLCGHTWTHARTRAAGRRAPSRMAPELSHSRTPEPRLFHGSRRLLLWGRELLTQFLSVSLFVLTAKGFFFLDLSLACGLVNARAVAESAPWGPGLRVSALPAWRLGSTGRRVAAISGAYARVPGAPLPLPHVQGSECPPPRVHVQRILLC